MLSTFATVFSDFLWSLRDRDGQGLVEYALIIVLVAIALIAGLTLLQGSIYSVFSSIGGTLTSNIQSGG